MNSPNQMLTEEHIAAIKRLARAVLSTRPLIDAIASPIHVSAWPNLDPQTPFPGGNGADCHLALNEFLNVVTARIGAPRPVPPFY
jgi:hypothetical protein